MWLFLVACTPDGPTITLSPADPSTLDPLVVSPTPPEGAVWSWQWQRNGHAVADLRGDRVPADRTARGEVWEVTVTTHDGPTSEATTAAVTIGNAPPSIGLQLLPAPPRGGEPLVASVSVVDPDEDPVALSFAWTLDGSRTAHVDAALPGDVVKGNQRWEVAVTATDGIATVTASAATNTANTAPALQSARITPDRPTKRDPLTVVWSGDDPEGDAVDVAVTWHVNEVPVYEGKTLAVDFFNRDDRVWAAVTPTDGRDAGPLVRTPDVFIANSVPTATGASVNPPTLAEGVVAACEITDGTDLDGDRVTAEVRWFVQGSLVATTPVLTSASFDKGDQVACEATATDGFDNGESYLSAITTVVNTPPLIGIVGFSPDPQAGIEVFAVANGILDADDDPVTTQAAWFVEGVFAGSGPSIAGLVRGQTVVVELTAFDGVATSLPIRSLPTIVGNAAPTVARAAMIPALPTSADEVTADVVVVDADGDPTVWNVTWTANQQFLFEGPELPAGMVIEGDELSYAVVPMDAFDIGGTAFAPEVIVGNGPPAVSAAVVLPDPLTALDTATCTGVGETDPDGDPVSYDVLWWVNGVDAGTGPTLSGFDSGEVVRCILTPGDGQTTGEPVWSAPVSVQ